MKCVVLLQDIQSRDNLNMFIDKFQGPATPDQIITESIAKILQTLVCQYEISICTRSGMYVQ